MPHHAQAQQNAAKLDSLTALLYSSQGKARVPVLNALPEYVVHDHPETAMSYIKEAERLSLELDLPAELGTVMFNYARYFHEMGKMDSSILYCHRSLAIRTKSKEKDARPAIAQSYNGLGAAHDDKGRKDSALYYYHEALKYSDSKDDRGIRSSIYANIGTNLIDQTRYREAIGFLKKGLDIDLEFGNKLDASKTMSNIGLTYQRLEMLDSALNFHQDALSIRREAGNMLDVARSLNNIGLVYRQMKLRPEAAEQFLQSLEIKRGIGNTFEVARTLNNLGNVYNEMGRYKDALTYLHEARQISDTLLSAPVRMNCLLNLSISYAGLRDFEKAYRYRLVSDSLQFDIANDERNQRVEQLMAQYETAEKEKQIISLRNQQAQADLEAIEMQQFQYQLIAGLAIVLLLGLTVLVGFFMISTRNRKLSLLNKTLEERNAEIAGKTAEIKEQAAILAIQNEHIKANNIHLERVVEERTANLKRSNAELDTFLYQSSHSLRGPLMRIKGLMGILSDENPAPSNGLLFEKVDYTIRGTDRMLFKLMDAAEIHRLVLRQANMDVRKLVSELVTYINKAMSYPDCEVRTDLPKEQIPVADHFLFETVMRNLIENALHFRYPGRQHAVEIQVEQADDKLCIRVRDNGMGIPTEELGSLGSMFHRATPKSAGMGLGLYVVRIALERIGGRLSADSVLGQWTEVRVELPVEIRANGVASQSQH